MSKKHHTRLSDELRAAIDNCGTSRNQIAIATGIDASVLCRFMQGTSGLSVESIDKLGEHLGLHLVADKPKAKPKRKKGK